MKPTLVLLFEKQRRDSCEQQRAVLVLTLMLQELLPPADNVNILIFLLIIIIMLMIMIMIISNSSSSSSSMVIPVGNCVFFCQGERRQF